MTGAENSDKTRLIFFGRWSFNSDVGELCDAKNSIRLEPQVAKLLEHFLAHQNRIISRDELIAAVWKNRVVSDDAINRCVSILRQILTPENKSAYIETVVRKGYLTHFPHAQDSGPDAVTPARIRNYLLPAALAAVVALFLYAVAGKIGEPSPEVRAPKNAGPPLVAVLPFVSSSQAGDDSPFFANGVHNDLLTQLAKLQSMRVVSSTSVMEYRDTEHNLRNIGKELGADVILEGSVQIVAEQIRINAQLIDTGTDEHLWAETYDRDLTPASIFAVQSEIARAIAKEMNTTLTSQDNVQLALVPTENMAAYRAYHRAMQMREASYAAIGTAEYVEALEQAVELDPAFGRAWAQLVNALALQNFRRNDPELTRKTERALDKLQAAGSGSADYLLGLAAYVYYALRDYDKAHDIISQVLSMLPGDTQVLELKSWIERRQGDNEAGLKTRKELRRLDPRNPRWWDLVVHQLFIMHRYDEAMAELSASPVDSFYLNDTRNFLLFRDDRNYARLQESTTELCRQYDEPDCGWETYIANRDYPKALNALSGADGSLVESGEFTGDRRRIFTHWLMNNVEPLSGEIPGWESELNAYLEESGQVPMSPAYIGLAMLAGIQGDAGEAERLIRTWLNPEHFDWAERNENRHDACRILGMIAATQAAVKCIRISLANPSHVTPFLEPYLPFYDPIRDQPEFISMLADIDPEQM